MVQIYRKKWQRGVFRSFFGYLRDSLVLAMPIKRLPTWLVKLLYGTTFKFAFLVHPRAYQDVFISMPIFKVLKFFLGRKKGYKFFSKTAPFVLDKIRTKHDVNGYVVGQLTAPEIMFSHRKDTLKSLKKSLRLVSKICEPGSVVGLGGWFPMVTKRGMLLKDHASSLGVTITNGHCGTLASIYMSVEKIAKVADIPFNSLTVAVVGVGKMGANVARAFSGKVRNLILVDVNEAQLGKVKKLVEKGGSETSVKCILSDPTDMSNLRSALSGCHVGIFATSSYRNILKLKDLPKDFVGIDDSRPEAVPRDPRKERIILEGGLLKISGAEINYNYGFGYDDNVFGCLGEAFLLACNRLRDLKPTLAEVDMKNFVKLMEYCKEVDVTEGDFRMGEIVVEDIDIKDALINRGLVESISND